MDSPIENILETIALFLLLGGWIYALIVAVLIGLSVTRKGIWLVSVIAASFAALALFSILRAPYIAQANVADQIYMISFQWGAFFTLSVLAVAGIAAKSFFRIKESKRPETHS